MSDDHRTPAEVAQAQEETRDSDRAIQDGIERRRIDPSYPRGRIAATARDYYEGGDR